MAWQPLRLPGKVCMLTGPRECGRSSLLFRQAVAHVASDAFDRSRRVLYIYATAPSSTGNCTTIPARPPIGLYEGFIENWVLRRIEYCFVDTPAQLYSIMAELHIPCFEPDGTQIALPSLILLDDLSQLLTGNASGVASVSAAIHEMIQILNSVMDACDYAADTNPHGCELVMADIWQDAGRFDHIRKLSRLEAKGRPDDEHAYAISLLDVYARYTPWVGVIEEKPAPNQRQLAGVQFTVSFEESRVYSPPFERLPYSPELDLTRRPPSWAYVVHTVPFLRMVVEEEK